MIRISGLRKSFGDRVILKDASYHFPHNERVALVGANGAGKTTLLNILTGLDEADGGTVVSPRDFKIGYLPQEANPQPLSSVVKECCAGHLHLKKLSALRDKAQAQLIATGSAEALNLFEQAQASYDEAGGDALESRAKGILSGLGFSTAQLELDPRSLSGGWRMRLELAKVFLNEPDFLILDEPTNHLDLPSLIWVETYLRQFKGCVLFVSHDRGLLNRLANVVLHLSGGQLKNYVGNFDAFLEQKELFESQDSKRLEAIARRKAELTSFIERFGAKATKAKQAQARAKMLSRLESVEDSISLPEHESTVSLSLPEPPQSGKTVLKINQFSIGYQREKPLASGIDLTILRGQKIAVIGSNGIGKSTFLQSLAEVLNPLDGHVEKGHNVQTAYFAQDQLTVLDSQKTVLENVIGKTRLSEKEARSVLGGFLFRGDDVFKKVEVLSGGEKNRVGLAILFSQSANLLILDEPTNHLDMRSAEVLSGALDDYEGSILCVSHDREFINSFATHIFVMLSNGRFELFQGNLDDYPRLAGVSGFPNILDPQYQIGAQLQQVGTESDKGSRARQRDDAQALKREKQRVARRIEESESELEKITLQIKEVEANLLACGSDYVKMQEQAQKLNEFKMALADTETQWMELNEQLEKLLSEGGGA